ncbi:HD domain-containing protein [Stigmatella aurantiaca]|uniref:Metal dependent phosphohydrolase, HD region n=1 Tax=Stigmatella aurantiaca (strain DW4/3-1) TaxID=378806 RepID=Q08T62_STIAD|nr:HD domain-containing protein [Stigmatella aurantiaca]ADO69928.1 Metal dependent phosphohydrolase, HD region [Stigmatella aurantiaca DW4/3-1]EAU63671.1 metal dependent phosphohydrolase, HD region [Stigmatella aurantiaca DW4/3-1]
MPTLEDAIALAVEAHRGQRDKAGQTYILHPLRVMMRLETEAERMAAILHDVVEDTPYTLERLRALGYPEEVLGALDCLTKREGETYEAFVERIRPHPLARRVKLADLEDNMDVRRLPSVGPREAERLTRYRAAWSRLKEA